MTLERELHALRHGVALSELPHVSCVRLSGPGAFDALDWLCPADLFLRDGKLLHSLLLTLDGRPFADVYVGRDDQDFLLLAEGPQPAELLAHLRAHAPGGSQLSITDLGETHRLLGLNGPWAWELLAELEGPEVIGLPYLEFFHSAGGGLCFRAGKTGEFGYVLAIPSARVPQVQARLRERGAGWDLAEAGLEALDQCALENWFFNIRREGQGDVTPLELQLRWRLSTRKPYLGAEAIARRAAEVKVRLTTVLSASPLTVGAPVTFEGRKVGVIANAGFSVERQEWVGLALIELALAWPGIAGFEGLRTVSPPVLNNLSLHVDPQRHPWRTRGEVVFPPLVLKEL